MFWISLSAPFPTGSFNDFVTLHPLLRDISLMLMRRSLGGSCVCSDPLYNLGFMQLKSSAKATVLIMGYHLHCFL